MNQGYSSRSKYDGDYAKDYDFESVEPGRYRLSVDYVHNPNRCMNPLGPRGSSLITNSTQPVNTAPAQDEVDVESTLRGINFVASRSRKGKVNPVNPVSQKVNSNISECSNTGLEPESTRLSEQYRRGSYETNRFMDSIMDEQLPVFWDFGENTSLTARDNYVPQHPKLWDVTPSLPKPVQENSVHAPAKLQKKVVKHN